MTFYFSKTSAVTLDRQHNAMNPKIPDHLIKPVAERILSVLGNMGTFDDIEIVTMALRDGKCWLAVETDSGLHCKFIERQDL